MKRMLCCATFAVWTICAALPAPAQEYLPNAEQGRTTPSFEKQGPSTFAFLKVTPTARVAAMGDAYTAVADGMETIYWNPAGIARLRKMGYLFGYTQWFVDSRFYSGAIAYNVGWGSVLGITVVTFQPPDIQETTTLQPTGTGKKVDVGDLAVGLVYAKQLTDKLSASGTIRYVESRLGPRRLKSVALNVSTLLHTGFRSFRIGMSMKNLGNELQLVNQKSDMPLVFHVGSAMELFGNLGDPASLTASFEGAYFVDRWQRYNLGGELWLKGILALRGGYKFRYDEESWSIGAGLKGKFSGHAVHLDFSYSDFGSLLEAPLRLTFSGLF